jgi:DNA-directed RNA polymerase subunit RPC12/RpoP
MQDHILPNPPGPAMFRKCEDCGRRFALVLVSSRVDEKCGTLKTFECKYCQAKVTFAERHPDGAV